MTETIGKSWNYVSSQLGVGGDYEGYRYATTEEINQLWTDADITTHPYIGKANSDFSAVQLLMGLLSPTFLYNSETAVYAMDNLVRVALLYAFVAPNGGLGSQIAKANFQTGNPATADSIFAGYLVKDAPSAVPIPAALPLFAAGLSVMGFVGWRKKQKTNRA